MPQINKNAHEQTSGSLEDVIEKLLANVVITTEPVVICGVNRKVNTGNFENTDIYNAVAIPWSWKDKLDEEILHHLAEQGFGYVSKETGDRVKMIKELQKSGRPPKGDPPATH